MNDEELGRRLSNDLHSRIAPPEVAPEVLHEHLRNLRSMGAVRRRSRGPAGMARYLFGVAAAIAISAVLVAGLLASQSPRTRAGSSSVPGPNVPAGIEMFGRIDAQTAWAEAGSQLYVTRDGGHTWSTGTVPGGRSPGQQVGSDHSSSATPNDATPTPIIAGQSPSGGGEVGGPNPAPTSAAYPDHFYPDFIDADHGWLLSWESPTFVHDRQSCLCR